MKKISQLVCYGLLTLITACASSPQNTSTKNTPPKNTLVSNTQAHTSGGATNPYRGTYVGTEVLEGGASVAQGAYPLKIHIDDTGRIEIVDIDNISAFGQMEGDSFRVVRGSPKQVFEGKVEGNTITGITTENVYTGDGTFSLTRQGN